MAESGLFEWYCFGSDNAKASAFEPKSLEACEWDERVWDFGERLRARLPSSGP